jgi:hypothetical protein
LIRCVRFKCKSALIDSSPRLKAHQVTLDGKNKILLQPKTGGRGWIHELEWSVSLPLPFITRETPTFIPLSVWNHAALFFLATLPDEPAARSKPFLFDAQIKWNLPEGGEPKQFRVSVVAINAKPAGVTTPELLANIEIAVSESE